MQENSMELSPAEVGIKRIRKYVGMWANPASEFKARDAMAAIAGVILDIHLPVPVNPAAAKVEESLRILSEHADAALATAIQPRKFTGLTPQQKDITEHLQDMIDQAMHKPGEWCEGVAAGGSIASSEGKIMPLGIGKMASRRDAFLVIDAINALPELLARLRSAEAGERSADSEVVRLQARVEEQVALYNQLIDATHAERDQIPAAVADLLSERRRQVAKGWTPEHDDEHASGNIAEAAGCYAAYAYNHEKLDGTPTLWPWEGKFWKPDSPRRNLVKAGALILAEIERLDRAAATKGTDLAPEEGLPDGLSWESAPADAIALIGGKNDDNDPARRLLVWVPDLGRATKGVLAVAFDGRPAGSPQNAALDSPNSMWTVLAHRPALLAEAAMLQAGIDPAPAEEVWFPHKAERPCPFDRPDLAMVDIRFRDGSEKVGGLACNYTWFWRSHDQQEDDIVAFRMHKPATDDDGWTKWEGGGVCPVDNVDELIWVRLASGEVRSGIAGRWNWSSKPDMGRERIVAYRLSHPDSL